MKLLDILITQYEEDEHIIKNLLDSIQIQQGVDFDDIGIIIVNDGSNVHLSETFLKSYNLDITYKICEHGGISQARNNALDMSEAEYVLWCDADDMFIDITALNTILRNAPFDLFISKFVEEIRKDNVPVFIERDCDSTFVHGKCYNRQFLIDNNIR